MAMFLGNCSYRYNVSVSYNSAYIKGGFARFSSDGGLSCGGSAGFSCGTLSSLNWCSTALSSDTPPRTFDGSTYYILTKYLTYNTSAGGSHFFSQSSSITTADNRTLSMSCQVLGTTGGWTSVGGGYSATLLLGACYHIQIRCTNSYINETTVLGSNRTPWSLTCQPCVE